MHNPVSILCDHFHYNLKDILRASHMAPVKAETLQGWYHSSTCPAYLKRRLFMTSMVTWGTATADNVKAKERKQLWECYFPDTDPHAYHVLILVFGMKQIEGIGLNPKTLKQSTLAPMQLKYIGKAVMNLADAMESPKRKEGPDYRLGRLLRNSLKSPQD